MMIIFVFIGIGIVLFTLGASFVLKAYLNAPNENTIVSKPEFDKVKIELTQSKESETKLKGQIEQLNAELKTAQQNLEASQAKEETALKNLQEWQTKAVPSEEMHKTTIQQLETELTLLREKAETQAKDTLEMVTSLTAENESLKGNSEVLKIKDQELEKNKELLKTLTAENETLKGNLASSQNSQEELNRQKDQMAQLISEKESLAKDLEISKQKIQELEVRLSQQADLESNLQKLKESNAALLKKEEALSYELAKSQAENNSTGLKEKYDKEKQEAFTRVAGLENEKADLLAVQTDLQRDLKKVQELNANFFKKEEMIQYELTKARAQAMGLEKIAEDFKTEIEKQLKQINDLKAENRSIRKLQGAAE